MAKLYYGDATTRLRNCEVEALDITKPFGKPTPIGIATHFGELRPDASGCYDEEAVNAICRQGIEAYQAMHGRSPATAPGWLLSTDEYADQQAEAEPEPTRWDGMPIAEAYTFASKFGVGRDWVQSSGRWDTMEQAAKKASEWLCVCAENGLFAAVRVESVTELAPL